MLFEDIKALDAVNAFITNREGNTMPATNLRRRRQPKPTVEANRAESNHWLATAVGLEATAVGLEATGESEARVNLAMKAAQRFEDFSICLAPTRKKQT